MGSTNRYFWVTLPEQTVHSCFTFEDWFIACQAFNSDNITKMSYIDIKWPGKVLKGPDDTVRCSGSTLLLDMMDKVTVLCPSTEVRGQLCSLLQEERVINAKFLLKSRAETLVGTLEFISSTDIFSEKERVKLFWTLNRKTNISSRGSNNFKHLLVSRQHSRRRPQDGNHRKAETQVNPDI